MPRQPRTANTEERPWIGCANLGCNHVFDQRGFGKGIGRPRRFCSDACRQAAYRAIKTTAFSPLNTLEPAVEMPVIGQPAPRL